MPNNKTPPVEAGGDKSACEAGRVVQGKHTATGTPGKVKHDTPVAIKFLQKFRPEGPWVLTSIVPDGHTTTATFPAEKWGKAAEWIEKRQGVENIYFHVNPTRAPLDSKAAKEDVAQLAWLHLDVDPRLGEGIGEERARILDLLTDKRPPGVPRPSVVISSGGGYQALWCLAEPLAIPTPTADNATPWAVGEAYNVQLEKVFQADHCFNVDRILRLPGTINLPNKKKAKKGRKPVAAELVDFNGNVYPLTAFTPAPAASENPPTRSRKRAASATLPVGVPMGTAELQAWANANGATIADKTLALIATGDAEEYSGDRSAMVFRVAGDLVRAGVPDALIVAALTDPNNPVSAHVREQKRNIAQYAQRQIDRARERELIPTDPQGDYSPTWDRVTKEGAPVYSFHNTIEALIALGVEFRFDDFRGQKVIGIDHHMQDYSGVLTDRAEVYLRRQVRLRFGFDVGKDALHEAITELCEINRFDSLRDHIDALPAWDGTPRLDTWLIDYCGAVDTPYTQQAGAAWLTAAIARAFEPGAKFDYMLILVGEQGMKKSAAFRVLASGELDTTGNDRFSDAPLLGAKDGREVLELSAGVWIQECAELDGITKKDVSALKAMIVRTRDKGRLVWSRTPVEVPRRFVIAGTTNEHRFLQDPTGNRRFWPVEVMRIDLEGLAAARDQILAEALARYRAGKYRLWLDDAAEREANKMQGERAVVDQGFYDLLEFMKAEGERDGARYVTNEFVYRRLGLDRRNRAGNVAHKVRAVMTALGWASPPNPVRIDGLKQRIYVWAGEGESPDVDTTPF